MKQWIKDTAGLGTVLWLIGYLASLVLFFTPYAGIMGWILLAVFTPVTIVIVWWWFRHRTPLPLHYYAGVGAAWVIIAAVLDYLISSCCSRHPIMKRMCSCTMLSRSLSRWELAFTLTGMRRWQRVDDTAIVAGKNRLITFFRVKCYGSP